MKSFVFLLAGLISPILHADLAPSDVTQVVLLGTGTPFPDPSRSGPGVAIVVNDQPYLVDFGAGIVRQTAAATPQYGGKVKGLEVTRLSRAFLTHLHSDHAIGLADLIFSPWNMGRREPLQVYGPKGIENMVEHTLKAFEDDIKYRLYSAQPANNTGWIANAYAIEPGVVYKDKNVEVEAFRVTHGTWPNAFGYRFTTPDRVIVISGDARADPEVEKHFRGADILIHEAYADAGLKRFYAGRDDEAFWIAYHSSNHTSGIELGEIANRVKPKLLVLYHLLPFGTSGQTILDEVKSKFDGEAVVGNDLDVF